MKRLQWLIEQQNSYRLRMLPASYKLCGDPDTLLALEGASELQRSIITTTHLPTAHSLSCGRQGLTNSVLRAGCLSPGRAFLATLDCVIQGRKRAHLVGLSQAPPSRQSTVYLTPSGLKLKKSALLASISASASTSVGVRRDFCFSWPRRMLASICCHVVDLIYGRPNSLQALGGHDDRSAYWRNDFAALG